MISLKVCGMKYPDNIREVASLQPDYLGFIFHEGSARYFEEEIPGLRDGIKTVGVFVNASVEKVLEKVSKYELKAVQLHGDESPEYCTELKEKLEQGNRPVELLKVFSMDETFDMEELKAYEGKADYFLFDARGKQRGGNGVPFNWDLLLEYDSSTPFFLSGGIGPEDSQKIKNFIDQLHQKGKAGLLRGLDVNSCFESEPGRKKPEDLRAFQQELQQFLNKKNSNI